MLNDIRVSSLLRILVCLASFIASFFPRDVSAESSPTAFKLSVGEYLYSQDGSHFTGQDLNLRYRRNDSSMWIGYYHDPQFGSQGRGGIDTPNGRIVSSLVASLPVSTKPARRHSIAVMPSIGSTSGRFAKPNQLFFGTFARQDEEEWIDNMIPGLRADSSMYRAMLRDIHQNGSVLLRKKYRFLGLAYRIFMIGLCLTVLAFTLEMLGLFGHGLAR
mgnify:CR=1 FL=1